MKHFFFRRPFSLAALFLAGGFLFLEAPVLGSAASHLRRPSLSARSAVVVDAKNGAILYGKNPHLRLPPASTTKVMTALIALERLPLNQWVPVSRKAASAERSVAGLRAGVSYRVQDLVLASLVSSSNDAAMALAEAVSGSEEQFVELMNRRAAELGMTDTHFVNSTGLTDKRRSQYSTAYDLTLLMRRASGDPRADRMMGILTHVIRGSDGKPIALRSHNKMLWRVPCFVKGKTGWTFASRHTFVGTNYSTNKKIAFAMLSSQQPWIDIQRLATFGLMLKNSR